MPDTVQWWGFKLGYFTQEGQKRGRQEALRDDGWPGLDSYFDRDCIRGHYPYGPQVEVEVEDDDPVETMRKYTEEMLRMCRVSEHHDITLGAPYPDCDDGNLPTTKLPKVYCFLAADGSWVDVIVHRVRLEEDQLWGPIQGKDAVVVMSLYSCPQVAPPLPVRLSDVRKRSKLRGGSQSRTGRGRE
jgi:hypothetical protein